MEKKQRNTKKSKTILDNNSDKKIAEKIKKRERLDSESKIQCQSSKINTINMLKKSTLENNDKALNNAFAKEYEDYPECSISQKSIGLVKSFAYITYKGLVKHTNEDKVIVVSPVPKPQKSKIKTWPKLSFFGVFDGHGGETCSEFLKDNFLNYLLDNKNFPLDIKLSLTETFEKLEETIINKNKGKSGDEIDNSGSCALVCVITESKIFMANLGDSRAIMSLNNGSKVKQLTVDHKPNNVKEYERIIKNGGKVYIDDDYQEDDQGKYDKDKLKYVLDKKDFEKYVGQKDIIFRHYPSDLAIMRSIGDIKSKLKEFGGLPGNIIAVPEVFVYDYSTGDDFIVMGCDGIFDDLSNEDVIKTAWYMINHKAKERNYDINLLCKDSCNLIVKYGMDLESIDNLTCIVIGMDGLQKYLNLKRMKEKK